MIKAESLQDDQRTLVMFLEDFGGESLEKLMQESLGTYPMPLSEFLHLAIKITEILGIIHAANAIHKDINPSNIVLNPATGVVKIIDFGISTQLPRTNPTFKHPNVLEGILAYISPEATGRMNRFLDYRTDFYSLGVTFYELLTGQLPFATTDVRELVHCHIAKQPILPHEVNSEIPHVVSSIVMKLMAKNASERYQSAWGIKADLEKCLAQFQHSGTITEFTLANLDISHKFQIPQKLYGREVEVKTLLESFMRLVFAGETCGKRIDAGNHPLVIFLDDLQWVDSATLKLIELIMTDSETQYLFLIGAYRDNEVNPTHPLRMALER